jgi:type II secretory pathway component PulK
MDVIYQKNRESRQGIALIMVVGMLALMMVMAVAFAIFMRTERATASSFRCPCEKFVAGGVEPRGGCD